ARSFRSTLTVLTAVHERGGLAAAALEAVRPAVDEVVVAFDSRMPRDQLGPLESIADKLIGFEFSGPNRFWPWLREQANGEWLLVVSGDEIVSSELLRLLPKLIAAKDISGYHLPCWWAFPNPTKRLISLPWGDHWALRLLRNDGRLCFPGTKHGDAVCDLPIRFVDAPFIHLDLLVNSQNVREKKVVR